MPEGGPRLPVVRPPRAAHGVDLPVRRRDTGGRGRNRGRAERRGRIDRLHEGGGGWRGLDHRRRGRVVLSAPGRTQSRRLTRRRKWRNRRRLARRQARRRRHLNAVPGMRLSPVAVSHHHQHRRRRPPSEAALPVDIPTGLEDVVSRVMPAVVRVETSDGTGSGFYVRSDTVLTNVHVVKDDTYVTLRQLDGSSVQARVDSRSPAYDIAVLKVHDALGQPGGDSAWFGNNAASRPGSDRDRVGAGHAAKQRDARHRQRRARKPRRHAGANRRRGQPGQ